MFAQVVERNIVLLRYEVGKHELVIGCEATSPRARSPKTFGRQPAECVDALTVVAADKRGSIERGFFAYQSRRCKEERATNAID